MEVNYINGSEIMLYVDDKPTLAAKSHKISYKSTTKQLVHKDVENSLYSKKIVTGLSVTITCDALVAVGGDGVASKDLLAKMKDAGVVRLKYGRKDKTGSYEDGYFVIDSIEETASAGEEATYTATFSNDGEVKTVQSVGG